ncbi:MAG: metal ABC transporter permease [Saprospiraceae bacterium]|nr:metal ABC transporter permease [Saprospiraceae bacterium]
MSSFFSFSDPNVQMVTLGVMLLGAGAAIVGCFTFVRKRALVGDAIAHAVLPGICLSFMITGQKHPLWLLAGAVVTGWLSLLFMDYITHRTKLKADAAIGAVLSLFFGLGILLLTAIQHSGSAQQAGLDKFLFGKAASLTQQDVIVFGLTTLLVLLVVFTFFKSFKLLAFDRDFAHAIGLPVRLLEFVLSTITVLSVATGIQAVGVVLMAALLITPAAAARFWTDSMQRMTGLAAGFGIVAGFFGAFVSYTAPSMPTGPWIVLLLSAIAVISVLLAPRRGILARWLLQAENSRKMLAENILKSFFSLSAKKEAISEADILEARPFSVTGLGRGLRRLQRRGLVQQSAPRTWQLTETGQIESRRVVRLHRLWELYLSHKLGLPADHVHNSAEAMEHLLTPEVEQHLLEELEYPVLDPHDSAIPYDIKTDAP